MDEVTWTVTQPDGTSEVISKREPIPFLPPCEITEKMPKAQVAFAEGWNKMRDRLLEIGEMRTK